MTEDERKKKLLENFNLIQTANREGYAGILPTGGLVDRRQSPEAYPIAANSMFNITVPRCIGCQQPTDINKISNSLCPECRTKTKT